MGQTPELRRLSDAAGRRADRGLAARFDLTLLGRFARAFARDERGATAIEYGLIAAGIFLVIIGAVTTFGTKTTAMFAYIASVIGSTI